MQILIIFLLNMLLIIQIYKLQLEAIVSSKEISKLQIGQNVNIFQTLKTSEKNISGIVSEVGFVPITMSNSYKILIDIQNLSSNLKLGMILNFSVELAHIDSVYMLSNRYILDEKIGNFIWINHNSIAKKVAVDTGDLIGHETIIEGELFPGIKVITDGTRQVKSGSKLEIVK